MILAGARTRADRQTGGCPRRGMGCRLAFQLNPFPGAIGDEERLRRPVQPVERAFGLCFFLSQPQRLVEFAAPDRFHIENPAHRERATGAAVASSDDDRDAALFQHCPSGVRDVGVGDDSVDVVPPQRQKAAGHAEFGAVGKQDRFCSPRQHAALH